MPRCSCPLHACACAGIRSMTTNPGARCALARSISRGCRPPVITAPLLPSGQAAARPGDARSPSYPGPSWCWPCAAARRRPEPVPGNAPPRRHPGNPMPAVPGRRPSRAHTAPVWARPYPAQGIPWGCASGPGCGRPRPSLPSTSTPAHAAAAPADPPEHRAEARTEVPSGAADVRGGVRLPFRAGAGGPARRRPRQGRRGSPGPGSCRRLLPRGGP